MNTPIKWFAIAASSLLISQGLQAESFFLMTRASAPESPGAQSYVVSTNDPELIRRAREFLQAGSGPVYLVPTVRVAMGADGVNRNYTEPGHPPWNWHGVELLGWTVYDPSGIYPAVFLPWLHSAPADVPQVLNPRFGYEPRDVVTLVHYPLTMELFPEKASGVSAVSVRGRVGAGENVLIAGFVVKGGTPRNVIVRAIGPSLARFGVGEPLADPVAVVFRGVDAIAENDDWANGNLAPEPLSGFEWLLPSESKEAALKLVLAPGNYTLHVRGANAGAGVALGEVYDLDALATR